MIIEINNDLDKYQETVVLGLTTRQFVYVIITCALGLLLVLGLYHLIGMTGAAYVSIPILAPIALQGFYSYQGMSFLESTRLRIKFLMKPETFLYVSSEGMPEIEADKREQQLEAKNKKERRK